MKRQAAVLVLILIALTALTIWLYERNQTSLKGVVVFEHYPGTPEPDPSGLSVFILVESIGPELDTLNAHYEKDVSAFEDSVNDIRLNLNVLKLKINEEEALLKILFSDETSREFERERNKRVVDGMIEEKETLEKNYEEKRLRLIRLQREYNGVIVNLIDRKVILKTETDESGMFDFQGVPKDIYYLYALRILAGDKDITSEPPGTYYMYALTAQKIIKYSWMLKVILDDDISIKLDYSNMADVFK